MCFAALFYRIGNCFPIRQKPPAGCALARNENVADATALGASISQTICFFIKKCLNLMEIDKNFLKMFFLHVKISNVAK